MEEGSERWGGNRNVELKEFVVETGRWREWICATSQGELRNKSGQGRGLAEKLGIERAILLAGHQRDGGQARQNGPVEYGGRKQG